LPKLPTNGREHFCGSAVLLPAIDCSALLEDEMGKGLLLWLIGIPIPIILVIWLFGGLG
jgi:hypothetical protein